MTVGFSKADLSFKISDSKVHIIITARQHSLLSCYAERSTSYSKLTVCPSVRLSVCLTLALCQNDSSYEHAVFTAG